MSKNLCGHVETGTYTGHMELYTPAHLQRDDGRGICVDVCLAVDISKLWGTGILTVGCCCGHAHLAAYIQVRSLDRERMEEKGYEELPDSSGSFNLEHPVFRPLTVLDLELLPAIVLLQRLH